ncbi:protein phosphatase 2C domain-containing protein [Massilia phyllostachyos]|uniref:protein phosphatase 2C domain-containing protein n=1 Tax=Massilia phyllostachyos TaxID=2898585 RepID=UPI0022AA4FB4|nr:protein phosphatase 2C domain-containing protein [Massilia phyllostachyos]
MSQVAVAPLAWRGWGVSCIGPGHRRASLPNQDAWLLRHTLQGELLVVADGLGSRALSHLGARAACAAAFEALALTQAGGGAPDIAILLATLHARWLARVWPHDPRTCATTCLLALRTGPHLILAQLGDGMVLAGGAGTGPDFMLASTADDFSNQTDCLRDRHEPQSWRAAQLCAADWGGVLLCTDGIAADLTPGRESAFAHALFAQTRNSSARSQRREARRWLGGWPVPGHTDDKTIGCLLAPKENSNA